jgi:hypothetical protein
MHAAIDEYANPRLLDPDRDRRRPVAGRDNREERLDEQREQDRHRGEQELEPDGAHAVELQERHEEAVDDHEHHHHVPRRVRLRVVLDPDTQPDEAHEEHAARGGLASDLCATQASKSKICSK